MDEMLRGRGGLIRGLKEVSKCAERSRPPPVSLRMSQSELPSLNHSAMPAQPRKKQRQATLTWEGAGAGAGAFRAPTPPPVVLRLDKDVRCASFLQPDPSQP